MHAHLQALRQGQAAVEAFLEADDTYAKHMAMRLGQQPSPGPAGVRDQGLGVILIAFQITHCQACHYDHSRAQPDRVAGRGAAFLRASLAWNIDARESLCFTTFIA